MTSPYLCVYGHVCLDQILSLVNLPEPNTSVDVQEKHAYYGGTGANIATIAASLGVPTALCSFVGPDMPIDFRRSMIDHGVDLGDMVTMDGYETSTVLIVSDERQDQVAYVYQGPMRDMGRFDLRLDSAKGSTIVHVSTGRPEYYLRLMRACREMEKEIAFDPAQEIHHIWSQDTFREAMSMSDLFFCNKNELRTALGYMGASSPEELLRSVALLINTRGAEGSLVFTSRDTRRVPSAKPGTVVDTTGAGDAFRAGFYAGRYRNKSLIECAAYGNATASFIIESRGSVTNIPTWEMVEERAGPILEELII